MESERRQEALERFERAVELPLIVLAVAMVPLLILPLLLNIETFGDTLWWATTTVTTVGYGDTYPVSPAGRTIATFLMISGIALFGVLTANIAAFFVERSTEAEEADQIEAKLDEIIRRLDMFEQRLKNNPKGGAAP